MIKLTDNQGWLKIYRKLLNKPIWTSSTPEQKVILITILLSANYEQAEWYWNNNKYIANPGQFITSLESLRLKCGKGISIQNIRTALNKFEKLQFLTSESTKTGRLITIVNWGLYQPNDNELTSLPTDKQQRPNKELTPSKKDKKNNLRKKEEITYETIINEFTNNESLRETLFEFIKMRKLNKKIMTNRALTNLLSKLQKFTNDIDEQIDILNRSIESCWTSIYPLKKEDTTSIKQQQSYDDPYAHMKVL